MINSGAEPLELTAEQQLDLNYLKLTWARFYALNCDGARWSAVPIGTDVVLWADSKEQMRKVLMLDAQTRVARRGHWIETASGPPYFVESSSASLRDLRDS